ncbi:hypothetical protein PspLS_09169 [Pyricularia sp. CBS 133598]|nr:hypothetical protein PspLS_09169 [Pyricularia sp. CBS 133598]
MSGFLSLIGWTFLPNLVTGWVQTIYYGITVRAGDPKPQPGTARYAEHRRRIHILVVSLYLLYTIYEADYELRREGSFYSDLGLLPSATEKEIKSRFRRLAAQFHPDKVSGDSDGTAALFFMRLKTAQETLVNPARRFAYDRLGPDVVSWTRCTTIRDFVSQGLQNLVPFYGATAAFMWFLGWMGYLEWGRTWRWLTFSAMFLFEVHVVTRPRHPALFVSFINPALSRLSALVGTAAVNRQQQLSSPYLPFQAIQLARKVAVTLYVAFSHIGPLLGADTSSGNINVSRKERDASKADEQLHQALMRLEQMASAVGGDADNLLKMELVPFQGDAEAVANVQGKMKEWLVNNTIRSDPMVRDALGTALRRRRVDAPHGAQGTK